MNKILLPAMIDLARILSSPDDVKENLEENPNDLRPYPWETARYDIPKHLRKGKTWEEIREMKRQIWLKEQEVKDECNVS
jgi:hypothetical protein